MAGAAAIHPDHNSTVQPAVCEEKEQSRARALGLLASASISSLPGMSASKIARTVYPHKSTCTLTGRTR